MYFFNLAINFCFTFHKLLNIRKGCCNCHFGSVRTVSYPFILYYSTGSFVSAVQYMSDTLNTREDTGEIEIVNVFVSHKRALCLCVCVCARVFYYSLCI